MNVFFFSRHKKSKFRRNSHKVQSTLIAVQLSGYLLSHFFLLPSILILCKNKYVFAILKLLIARDRNVMCVLQGITLLLWTRFTAGVEKSTARCPEWNFTSGWETKKNDHRSRVCSRFLIAARKNHPNTSVYVHHIIYNNMVLRHCYYYCTAANIMRNERWSSGGHPSKIIGFLRAVARAAGAVFDIIIHYLNILLSNRILFNII